MENIKPTKENSLYLTIKQQFFNEIIDGTKKKEYREIKDTTYTKYLEVDENGAPFYDMDLASDDAPFLGSIYIYNNGVYPYIPKESIEFLSLAVGYNKDRETAIVKVEDISFEPLTKNGVPCRFSDDGENMAIDPNGDFCFWQIVFHLGEVVKM